MARRKSKKKLRKSGLKILGMVLLNRNSKVLYDLEREITELGGKVAEKKKMLSKLDERFEQKKASYDYISRKIKQEVNQMENVKALKNQLKSEQIKKHELEMKLRKIRKKSPAKRILEKTIQPQPNTNGHSLEQIKQKYPNLPKNQLERIEIQRTIARHLMAANSGCFYVSQLLKTIEDIYSIKSDDRVMLLNEIKNWIERDPLCKAMKKEDSIQHYTLI